MNAAPKDRPPKLTRKAQKSLGQVAYEVIKCRYASWQPVRELIPQDWDDIARAVEREVFKRLRRKYPLVGRGLKLP